MDHPSNDAEAILVASFKSFQSQVSRFLSQILSKSKPGSDFISSEWIHHCFDVIPLIHKAYFKLLLDIDYPMIEWKAASCDNYFDYTLSVLEFLNMVSSSLSHLEHAQISLSHALVLINENSTSLASSKHFQEIPVKKDNGVLRSFKLKVQKEDIGFDKELVIQEALMMMKRIGILLFGIIISVLCCDERTYIDLKVSAMELNDPLLFNLDSNFSQEVDQNGCIMKEVKVINQIVTADYVGAVEELSAKLEVLKIFLQSLGKHKEALFSDVLEARNKLLDTLRQKEQDRQFNYDCHGCICI